MPEISRFMGIVIQMYYDDHSTPQIHARHSENRPRYESLKWYLEIIGLDFSRRDPSGEAVIKRINQIPKLY